MSIGREVFLAAGTAAASALAPSSPGYGEGGAVSRGLDGMRMSPKRCAVTSTECHRAPAIPFADNSFHHRIRLNFDVPAAVNSGGLNQ